MGGEEKRSREERGLGTAWDHTLPGEQQMQSSNSLHPAQVWPKVDLPEFPQGLGKCFQFLVIISDSLS